MPGIDEMGRGRLGKTKATSQGHSLHQQAALKYTPLSRPATKFQGWIYSAAIDCGLKPGQSISGYYERTIELG